MAGQDVGRVVRRQRVGQVVAGAVDGIGARQRQVLDVRAQDKSHRAAHRVGAFLRRLGHRVAGIVHVVRVVAHASGHRVGTGAAHQHVVALAAGQRVVAALAVHPVVAALAVQDVSAISATQRVVGAITCNGARAVALPGRFECGLQRIPVLGGKFGLSQLGRHERRHCVEQYLKPSQIEHPVAGMERFYLPRSILEESFHDQRIGSPDNGAFEIVGVSGPTEPDLVEVDSLQERDDVHFTRRGEGGRTISAKLTDDIEPITPTEKIGIRTASPGQVVFARTAGQGIVPVLAAEVIAVGATLQGVVSVCAVELVVAVATIKNVIARADLDGTTPFEPIVSIAAFQDVPTLHAYEVIVASESTNSVPTRGACQILRIIRTINGQDKGRTSVDEIVDGIDAQHRSVGKTNIVDATVRPIDVLLQYENLSGRIAVQRDQQVVFGIAPEVQPGHVHPFRECDPIEPTFVVVDDVVPTLVQVDVVTLPALEIVAASASGDRVIASRAINLVIASIACDPVVLVVSFSVDVAIACERKALDIVVKRKIRERYDLIIAFAFGLQHVRDISPVLWAFARRHIDHVDVIAGAAHQEIEASAAVEHIVSIEPIDDLELRLACLQVVCTTGTPDLTADQDIETVLRCLTERIGGNQRNRM